MIELTMHLTGGQSVKIECTNFEYRTENNELVSLTYRWPDEQLHQLPYTRLDAVAMIEVRKLPDATPGETSG